VLTRAVRSCGAALFAPQPLPFHYIEISVALFKYAGDAFGERRQRVYDLVDNIRRRVPRQRTATMSRRARSAAGVKAQADGQQRLTPCA
jgi:hypothetical protein